MGEKGSLERLYTFKLLEKVQSRYPEHIPADLEARSCRRGANSEAQNAPNKDCKAKDINENNL